MNIDKNETKKAPAAWANALARLHDEQAMKSAEAQLAAAAAAEHVAREEWFAFVIAGMDGSEAQKKWAVATESRVAAYLRFNTLRDKFLYGVAA